MAHELSFTNGAADMVYVGETPWHREGTPLPIGAGYDDAMQAGKIDYDVVKLPTFRRIGESEEFVESKVAFVTYRPDRAVELGSVGTDYTVVQNRDAFSPLRPLMDEGLLALETAGVLRNGADAWMLGRFNIDRFGPVVREVFGDEVIPYVVIAANHSGRRGNVVALTPIRVVCANTLGFMEKDEASLRQTVRHTGDAVQRTAEAAESLLGGIVERYEAVARAFRLLKATRLGADDFKALVIEPAIGAHPTKRHGWNPEARMAESVVARWEAKSAEITRLWTAGKGHVGDASGWEAYNAVVEAIDHNAELFPTRSGVYRTQALIEGELRKSKQRALDALVKAAERGELALVA